MPRAKKYTLAYGNELGGVDVDTYETADALRDALAHWEDKATPLVFVGEPVSFQIDRTPRVIIGAAKARKPRAKKGEGARPRKAKGTTVTGDFFDKPGNGAAATPPTPAPVTTTQQEG